MAWLKEETHPPWSIYIFFFIYIYNQVGGRKKAPRNNIFNPRFNEYGQRKKIVERSVAKEALLLFLSLLCYFFRGA
jgi:hypothetical protein